MTGTAPIIYPTSKSTKTAKFDLLVKRPTDGHPAAIIWTLDVKHRFGHAGLVILGFRDKRTAQFATGGRVAAFSGFDRQAHKRLGILAATTSLADLRALPSNRLETLRGDRAGQYSIRINDQWRVCFEWPEDAAGPSSVEIVDYH